MKIEHHPLYGISDIQKLLKVLKITQSEIEEATKEQCADFYTNKKGKKRRIIAPGDNTKEVLRSITLFLQMLDSPSYNFAGWKGSGVFKNAEVHKNKHVVVTTDIAHYYESTTIEHVRAFFENELKMKGSALEFIEKITTYNSFLPTGFPTSPTLAFLVHQKLFDRIAEEMEHRKITFTLYCDDMTLSANHGITHEEIRYIQTVLDEHNLKLKTRKTKFFSYKKAFVTGYYINQGGKIAVPYRIGQTVIKKLKDKPIKSMNKSELCSLLGSISYQQQGDKKAFRAVKPIVIKKLTKLLRKEEKEKQLNKTCHFTNKGANRKQEHCDRS